jgi:hypothetical protein
MKSSGSRKPRLTAVGICCVDHRTPLSANLTLISQTSGGRSVGIVRLRTKATEFSFVLKLLLEPHQRVGVSLPSCYLATIRDTQRETQTHAVNNSSAVVLILCNENAFTEESLSNEKRDIFYRAVS